jgi:hypothetical protein
MKPLQDRVCANHARDVNTLSSRNLSSTSAPASFRNGFSGKTYMEHERDESSHKSQSTREDGNHHASRKTYEVHLSRRSYAANAGGCELGVSTYLLSCRSRSVARSARRCWSPAQWSRGLVGPRTCAGSMRPLDGSVVVRCCMLRHKRLRQPRRHRGRMPLAALSETGS